MISTDTAHNASVNYGKNNDVFQKLRGHNSGIIKAICMAHIVHNYATHAWDRMDIDSKSVVNKIFKMVFFSAFSKHTGELTEVFAFLEEHYQVLLRHVPISWLTLWPAVKRLHDSWGANKSHFLSLGEDQCHYGSCLKIDQDGEGKLHELQVYPSFLKNALKICHRVAYWRMDMEKAFDNVPHDNKWKVLWGYGVRGPLLRAGHSLYDGSRSLGTLPEQSQTCFPAHVRLWHSCPPPVTNSVQDFYGQKY